MALLDRCFCCNLAIGCGFLAIYLLIAYLIAFAFELLWILESHTHPPMVAILVCAGYFTLALFAALLVHGLATKNTFCLVAWMISVTILTFPEAGLVIYLSIQYWRIETIYGMTELACWLARIIANVIGFVAIQSLYTIWKEEEMVDKRLRDLSMAAVTLPRDASLNAFGDHGYQNNAYNDSCDHISNLKRASSMPVLWNTTVPNNMGPYLYDGYQYCTSSEFNASVFIPKSHGDETNDLPVKKAQSLMDLRILEDQPIIEEKIAPMYPPWTQQPLFRTNRAYPGYSHSLNRRSSSKMAKFCSLDNLNDEGKSSHIIRHRTGFYAQPIENYGVPIYYGPLDGPDFLIYKKQIDKFNSKNSLSNTSTDDVQKYRDVAL